MARYALISAALRHIRDAEHLFATGPHRSLEQALHLAGFAPECARKGCIDEKITDQALGHDISDEQGSVVDLVIAIDPSASRYGIDEDASALPERARSWRPDCRYGATGSPAALEEKVERVMREARSFVDERVLELWSDGALDHRALSWPKG